MDLAQRHSRSIGNPAGRQPAQPVPMQALLGGLEQLSLCVGPRNGGDGSPLFFDTNEPLLEGLVDTGVNSWAIIYRSVDRIKGNSVARTENSLHTSIQGRSVRGVFVAKLMAVLYGSIVYLFFLVTFLYTIGFVEGVPGIKTIDSGSMEEAWVAILVDVMLLGVFAVQHSVMARQGFKRWWTRFVPQPIERSTYVLAASLAVALLLWQWRPLPASVWTVDVGLVRILLYLISAFGWVILLTSTFLINHFELFGLRQVFNHFRSARVEPSAFKTPALYRFVRHPLYLGFILAFWATPHMTQGHLLFAVATTAYIFVGIFFEERDLIAHFGDEYRRYRQRVPMIFPFRRQAAKTTGHRGVGQIRS